MTWTRRPAWGVADRPQEGEHGGRIYLAPLDTGVIHVLAGPAAVVCRGALLGHDVEGVRQDLASELAVPLEDVDTEAVVDLLEELEGMGVLQRA